MTHAVATHRARSLWGFVLVSIAGCGEVKSVPDASMICAPTTKFGPLIVVPGLSNPSLDESTPRLSPDERTVYFTVRVPDPINTGRVLDANLYVGQRATVNDAFVSMPLDPFNTDQEDQDPTVSSDGLRLWFSSNRVANEGYHTYLAERASTASAFPADALAANINGSDKTRDDGQNFVTTDGSELWFTSTRAGTVGSNDIWMASLTGSTAGAPTIVPELNSPSNDWLPVLSADRLIVYLSSNRPGSAIGPTGAPSYDIWMSHRATVTDSFPAPTRVPELSTPADEFTGWLSPDHCRIYMSSIDSAGQHLDIFMATREP